MEICIGIDWGNEVHSVCAVQEQTGDKVFEREIKHSGEAITLCVDQLLELAGGDEKRVHVAIEMPHGAVVETFMDRGVAVYSINPKQLDRFRDRYSVSGAKDDRFDAYVLADTLRTDRKLYRPVVLGAASLVELRDMSRLYESLTAQVIALGNQIQPQLARYYVQLSGLGSWHEEPWLWDLFEAAPTPQRLERLRQSDVKAILKRHRIRRHKPLALLESLQQQQPLVVAPGVCEGASARISMLLPILRATHQQRRASEKQMERLLKQPLTDEGQDKTHRDADLLLALPGVGKRNGAAMLAEGTTALQQRDYQSLRRLSGTAPVTKRTGGRAKKPMIQMRRACNPRLRNAVRTWADVAKRVDPRTRQHYKQLRAKGHNHSRALRGVADRLLKLLVSMLNSGKPFDSTVWNNQKPAQGTP